MSLFLIPATVSVGVKRRVQGEIDRHGNAETTFVDDSVLAYGVAPRQREENDTLGRDFATHTVWDIYAPAGTEIGPYDRVILDDGTECNVEGKPAKWFFQPLIGHPVEGVQFTVSEDMG